ncbi:hypothetical protein JZ751_029179 [Albula glossodonta]|uniref:Ig-like domain-containing protein n=1 Tax=Albula glossodonta TaxID=121402 RepID=A0A8T2PGV4_9TELE|nr:hypothetical protein JZ751_029179 [Albula glossodonta]
MLQLSCEVTRLTSQHTHLSVGWYLRSPDPSSPPQDLVSLSRDFVLRPGAPYRQRFTSGDVRLDKISSATYRLTIYKLQPADQGVVYCEAAEWIQDPDRSWYAMVRKQSDKTTVKVQPTDRDFSIQVNTDRRAYMAGEALELRCSIDAQNVADRYFSVSWVFSSTPVAVVGPNGVPSLGTDYVEREAVGQLTVRKESPSVHLLKLRHLKAEDAGKYICRVTEREKTPTGDFIDRSKRSRNVQITVQPLKSNITVWLSSNSSEVQEGDPISLTCSGRGSSSRGGLSVSWEWKDGHGGAWQELASLDRDGTVGMGPSYRERGSYGEIGLERSRSEAFSLTLHHALPADEGQYRCTVTEWLQAPDRSWEKIGGQTAVKPLAVKAVGRCTDYLSVALSEVLHGGLGRLWVSALIRALPQSPCSYAPTESSFFVSASSRTPSVTYGDSFDLQCIVKPRHNPRAPVAVTWRFQPHEGSGSTGGGAEFRDLVTLTREGTLRWGELPAGVAMMRASLDRSASNSNFRLSVSRAGQREGGTYQCSAQLWRRNYDSTWTKIANRTSNLLGINVLKPVSKLRVLKSNQSLWFVEDSRVRVNCSITSQTSLDSQHTVLWYARKGSEPDSTPELLLKINHAAGFEYGTYAEEERLKSRVQSERLSPRMYGLTLHRAETSDSGTYYCQVEEWLLDPEGVWYHLAHDTSGFTQVAVMQPEVRLQVEEAESNVTVSEEGSIRLGCSIPSQSSRDSRFSVSWYILREGGAGEGAEPQCVFSIGHDAVFGNGNCSPAEPPGPNSRLSFERTTSDLYSLTIQRAGPGDAGSYYCHVEEWLLNPRNAWYRLATNNSGVTIVNVQQKVPSLQSVVCSNDSLFYFVFFYPFPIFGILLIALLLVRYKARHAGRNQEGKNGAPLLWIKEPHLNYSPTCLEPPALSLHPGSVE